MFVLGSPKAPAGELGTSTGLSSGRGAQNRAAWINSRLRGQPWERHSSWSWRPPACPPVSSSAHWAGSQGRGPQPSATGGGVGTRVVTAGGQSQLCCASAGMRLWERGLAGHPAFRRWAVGICAVRCSPVHAVPSADVRPGAGGLAVASPPLRQAGEGPRVGGIRASAPRPPDSAAVCV